MEITSITNTNDLTTKEQEIFENLPGPPVMASIQSSNIWIIEWLPPNERHTGKSLHDWMKERRPGWSAYYSCKSKADVIKAIACATIRTQKTKMIPVLHLEAHGDRDNEGLIGPGETGSLELLEWDKLTLSLQQLNLATRCNLVVVVAACTGFAGIKALCRGPRAPAVALVGPDATVTPNNLLWGTKEFYRRWMDNGSKLSDIAESASREAGTVCFEWEPFAVLAFNTMIASLIISMRPEEQHRQVDRIRQLMLADNKFSDWEIEHRLSYCPSIPSQVELQLMWDKMFMIDLFPENRERFGIDMNAIIKIVTQNIDNKLCVGRV
jgi:hypothetical protein